MWKVCVHGDSLAWEISVIKGDHHGWESWGWFDDNKLPYSEGPDWAMEEISEPLRKLAFKAAKNGAQKFADELNSMKK